MRTNICIFAGRICRDLQSFGSDTKKVLRTGIAVERAFKREGEEDADFPDLIAFGKVAERMEKYVEKGDRIVVKTRYKKGSYEHEGKTIYTHDFVVDDFDLIETKASKQAMQQAAQQSPYSAQRPGQAQTAPMQPQGAPQQRPQQPVYNTQPAPQPAPMQNYQNPGANQPVQQNAYQGYDDGAIPFSLLESGGPMPWQ